MNKKIADVKLQLRYNNGMTATGKPSFKTVSYSKIKKDAADDELLAAGTAIASLQTLDFSGVRVVDVYDLDEGA